MYFGEKSIVGPEKSFSSTDFYQYTQVLVKEAIERDKKCTKSSNYSWLKAKELNDTPVDHYLEDLRPIINKMTSESCAAIAVKLDRLTEEQNYNITDLVTLIKKLLEEQDNAMNIEKKVKRVKETKNVKKINKVHPELSGRQATVCFIVESDVL